MAANNRFVTKYAFISLLVFISWQCLLLPNYAYSQEQVDDQVESSQDQENLDSADLPPSQVILTRERLTQEIQDQRDQLLGQLAEYQHDERRYKVALDQFQRLQTLSSIEEVVIASRKLILSRNLVLNSYLNLLRLKLVESEGIEVRHKNQVIGRLEGLQQQLIDHSTRAEDVNDREAINQLAEEFIPLSESIIETSHYALSVLAIGRLQSVYDQSVVVHQRILQKEEEQKIDSSAVSSSRTRSLSEIDRLINELPPVFLSVWTKVDQTDDSRYGYRNLYRSITTELNSIYSRLSRLTAYFEELENVKQ
jgi:hypothetical protein